MLQLNTALRSGSSALVALVVTAIAQKKAENVEKTAFTAISGREPETDPYRRSLQRYLEDKTLAQW